MMPQVSHALAHHLKFNLTNARRNGSIASGASESGEVSISGPRSNTYSDPSVPRKDDTCTCALSHTHLPNISKLRVSNVTRDERDLHCHTPRTPTQVSPVVAECNETQSFGYNTKVGMGRTCEAERYTAQRHGRESGSLGPTVTNLVTRLILDPTSSCLVNFKLKDPQFSHNRS